MMKHAQNELWKVSKKLIYFPLVFCIVFFAFLLPCKNRLLFAIQEIIAFFCSLIIFFYLLNKKENIILHKKILLLSFFSSSIISITNMSNAYINVFFKVLGLSKIAHIPYWATFFLQNIIFIGEFACIVYMFLFFTYIIYHHLYHYVQRLEKSEKIILTVTWIIFSCLIIFSYTKTNVFFNTTIDFDLVYTSDTGNFYNTNVWMILDAPENDIRQPLFALFSAPFCAIPFLVSKIIFFIPDSYAYLLTVAQIFILLLSLAILSRIIINDNVVNRMFLFAVLSTSFPALLFSLNMEQYIFSVFWLIIFIQSITSTKPSMNWRIFSLLAATGSLMTSWILIVTLWKKNKIFSNIKEYIKIISIFVLMMIFFFRIDIIINTFESFSKILKFTVLTNEVECCTFNDRICQFSNFVYSCFFSPNSIIASQAFQDHPFLSYQLCPCSTVNICGCIFFGIAIGGFILNYKQKIAQISFLWVTLSVLLLLICGYGASENGMVLYTLYFFWAYYVLFYLALIKSIPDHKNIHICIIVCMIILQMLINIPGIEKIIQFGIKYYPK